MEPILEPMLEPILKPILKLKKIEPILCLGKLGASKKGFSEEVSLDEKGELGTISRRKGGSKH